MVEGDDINYVYEWTDFNGDIQKSTYHSSIVYFNSRFPHFGIYTEGFLMNQQSMKRP